MPSDPKPSAEHPIDAALVRDLLAEQHPDLAGLPVAAEASGWDNEIFRLGEALCVRLPRRRLAADLVRHEQRWLPRLAPVLPLSVPVPVRTGGPGQGYPWHWSICRWLPGETAATAPPRDLLRTAGRLGAFVAALHAPAPADAPANAFRGGPLSERSETLERRLARLGDEVDGAAIRACWAEGVDAPVFSGAPVWLHGDLHPANLLVARGRLSAVIDFGDLTAGDPATDLSLAWMLFPPALREAFRAACGDVDDATWRRARAWALSLSVAYLARSADAPQMRRIGERTLAAVLAEG